MAIVIKKKIDLDFLGEDYKDASLTFQAIPLKDFDEIVLKIDEAQKNNGSVKLILATLKEYFLEGIFPGIEKVTADDLDGLDPGSVVRCFQILTGQEFDPKDQALEPTPLPTQSSTTADTQP